MSDAKEGAIEVSRRGDVFVVVVRAEFVGAVVDAFDGMMTQACSTNRAVVHVATNYASLKALKSLVGWVRRFRKAGGDVRFVRATAYFDNLVSLCGVRPLMDFYQTVDEAVESFTTDRRNHEED